MFFSSRQSLVIQIIAGIVFAVGILFIIYFLLMYLQFTVFPRVYDKPQKKYLDRYVKEFRFSKDSFERRRAAGAIVELGPDAEEAIPVLIEILEQGIRVRRFEAAETIGQLGPHAADAVPALREALDDEYELVRQTALRALGEIGPKASNAVDDLVRLLEGMNEDYAMGEIARDALAGIGVPAIQPLYDFIISQNDGIPRDRGIRSLRWIGKEAVPVMIDLLEHKDSHVRSLVINQFRDMRADAEDALPPIMDALDDEEYLVRYEAELAVEKIGLKSTKAIPFFIGILNKDADERRLSLAIKVLAALGPKAESSVDVLKNFLGHENTYLRAYAAGTLLYIDPPAEYALPVLLESLKDRREKTRWVAAYSLLSYSANPEVVDAMRAMLKDDAGLVRAAAVKFFGTLGVDSIPVLIQALYDKNDKVRLAAVEKLADLGAAATEALPKLREMAENDPEIVVLSAASNAIITIEGP